MGSTTPNIGIYLPADGESLYGQSFAAGMLNVDQHDHTGAPNKGVPIGAGGIADGSITRQKLNANVVSPGNGLAVDPALPNALMADGLLNSLYKVSTKGLLGQNGTGTAQVIAYDSVGKVLASVDVNTPPVFTAAPAVTSITLSGGTALNRYVEGTWTPVLSFGGGSTGIVYAVQEGFYTRIGRVVYVSCLISLSNKGSSTGVAVISGFPIQSANTNQSPVFPLITQNIILDADNTVILFQLNANSTTGGFIEENYLTGGGTNPSDTIFANNSSIMLNGFYFV